MTSGKTISGTMVTSLGFFRTFLFGAWFLGPAM
jgi:hypothetical protein